MTQLLSIILRGIEKMGTSNEDKESVIRCKDCLFFEHDSIYVDGIIESAGTHGTCNAWNRSKTSEEGYCHLAALKPEKMTVDKAIEILSKEAFVIAKNLTEWTMARDVLVDIARKYQKIDQHIKNDWQNGIWSGTTLNKIEDIMSDGNVS